MCVAGAVVAVLGWRMWRAASVVSLALLGAFGGQLISSQDAFALMFVAGGAAFGVLVGVALFQYAATILGGVVGGVVLLCLMHPLGITGPIVWVVAGVGFIGAVAWSFANQHRVVVVITAIEGSALFVSGFAVMLQEWPTAYHYMRTTAMHHAAIFPFFILVPTVIGVCLQLADSARSYSKAVRT